MTSTKVQIKNIGKVNRFMIRLPKELDKQLSKTNLEFMKNIQRDAKKAAPKDTGSLAEDIKLVPVRKGKDVKIWELEVDNPAAAPQEFGFSPHFAPIFNSSKMAPGIYFVKKNTPFLFKSVEKNFQKYINMLSISSKRAIINSGR